MIEPAITFLAAEYGPFMVILIYLYLRDRRMERAILQLADETEGVNREKVREKLEITIGD